LYLYKNEGGHFKLWDIRPAQDTAAEIVMRWPEPGAWKILVDPLVASGPAHPTLSEVLTGAPMKEPGWAPIRMTETIDSLTEREIDLAPLVDHSRYPQSSFRPVAVKRTISSIPATNPKN